MATYECSKCGMSVNATCGKCNEQLVNDTIFENNLDETGDSKNVDIVDEKLPTTSVTNYWKYSWAGISSTWDSLT